MEKVDDCRKEGAGLMVSWSIAAETVWYPRDPEGGTKSEDIE